MLEMRNARFFAYSDCGRKPDLIYMSFGLSRRYFELVGLETWDGIPVRPDMEIACNEVRFMCRGDVVATMSGVSADFPAVWTLPHDREVRALLDAERPVMTWATLKEKPSIT